jgi:hypothetical protein
MFQSEPSPQLAAKKPTAAAAHLDEDDFASISLGDVASGETTPTSRARAFRALLSNSSRELLRLHFYSWRCI